MRYNDAEYEEILTAAAERAQTVSRFCATSTLNAARGLDAGDPQDRIDDMVDELASARSQLARVGNNVNQIAFALNANGYHQPAELGTVLGSLRQAIAAVDGAAAKIVSG